MQHQTLSAERILAYIVDLIVMTVINFIIAFGFSIISFILFFLAPVLTAVAALISLIFPVLYFYITEYKLGKTIGHMLFGLKVTGYENASRENKLKRTLLKYPLLALVVFIYALISGRYLHEELSGIRTEKA